MNSTIGLPKEFTDNNPKAKRSEYPELTGFGVLHLGKFYYWSHYVLLYPSFNELIHQLSLPDTICRLDQVPYHKRSGSQC
jgi:hypothetical protein